MGTVHSVFHIISVCSVPGPRGTVVVLLFEEIPLSVSSAASGLYMVFLVLVAEVFKFSKLVKTDWQKSASLG